MRHGLRDPISAVRAYQVLELQIQNMGLRATISSDMEQFAHVRKTVRKEVVSPMFDPSINSFDEENSFWVMAKDDNGEVMALEAFRLDIVDCKLSEWALRWMVGLYVLRSELAVPSQFIVPADSATQDLRGPFIYHGEVWVHSRFRTGELCTAFSRLGLITSLIKWQPNVVWGLIVSKMASRGLTVRMGYPHAERGFLKWNIPPKGADISEYITFATKSDLEFLAHEISTTQS